MKPQYIRRVQTAAIGLTLAAATPIILLADVGEPTPALTTLELDLSKVQPEPAAPQPDASSKTPSEAAAGKTQPPTPDAATSTKSRSFGIAGSNWFSVGIGYMHDFEENQAGELHLGLSHFIADEVEFNVELTGWYFDQTGDNTGGINPGFNFRWHFLHDAANDWTLFAEAGIGLLFAFDEVPDGGTGFNFTPRAGLGFTTRIDDTGDRLQIGLRWQHISNGRIEGDARNPGRDSLMGYVGIMFPF